MCTESYKIRNTRSQKMGLGFAKKKSVHYQQTEKPITRLIDWSIHQSVYLYLLKTNISNIHEVHITNIYRTVHATKMWKE